MIFYKEILFFLVISNLFGSIAFGESDFKKINKELAYHHIIPRYNQFRIQTKKLNRDAINFCNNIQNKNLTSLRNSFHFALDSWMNVQHIQFGPIDKNLRLYRVLFWPDKHNSSTKHLSRLIKSLDNKIILPNNFIGASVAVQGFSALEKLIFQNYQTLFSLNEEAKYRCKLIKSITNNLYKIASSVLNEWKDQKNGFLKVISSDGSPFFEGEKQIFSLFYKSLLFSLKNIHELKLKRPLGKSFDYRKPKKSESWRSKRSLRNIVINLKAIQSLYINNGNFGMYDYLIAMEKNIVVADKFHEILSKTIISAQLIKKPLSDSIADTDGYQKLIKLREKIFLLIEIVEKHFAVYFQIDAGFNSLDGD
tara:strand:- start:131 stop:1225 length:1095 start_codon:yes stop_codon:yes gene_type:complete